MSKIEWTETTWNPVTGCTRASAGCDNCYAVTMTKRLAAMGQAKYEGLVGNGHFNGVVKCHHDELAKPFKWKRPRRVFVNSMSDLFHPAVPFGFIMQCLWTMAHTPQHTYQILTKRPDRACQFFQQWADLSGEDYSVKMVRGPEATRKAHPSGRGQLFADMLESMGTPPPGCAYPTFDWMEGPIGWPDIFPNVWLGTSVENQAAADQRIPYLLQCPAAVRFLSCEPLIGPVDLSSWMEPVQCLMTCQRCGEEFADGEADRNGRSPCCGQQGDPQGSVGGSDLDWVIVGGESGRNARISDIEWIRSIVRQCAEASVPCFVKQLGENAWDDASTVEDWMTRGVPRLHTMAGRVNISFRNRKGGDPCEWPEDLRVREFPEVGT